MTKAKSNIRIVFMGTPEFAVPSLSALLERGFEVSAVVTAPDRPAGRGQQITTSAVKQFAGSRSLKVLQPSNLKDETFIGELRSLQAELFIVVAFRMLPEIVWQMPPLGTFNLHASLLPQYRGAAPINWAIINGEKTGGVTTFFLKQAIDTGNIIFREETPIGDEETAGDYHDRLMILGAGLVVKTAEAIVSGDFGIRSQEELVAPGTILKKAPKIFREDCRIDWSEDSKHIYNLIRGLSPYPGAFTEIATSDGKKIYLKVFKAEIRSCSSPRTPGTMKTDAKTYMHFCCRDACISILEVQQAGKKRMGIEDFLAGLNIKALP